MSGTPAALEDFGVDSFSVVPNVQAELADLVADLASICSAWACRNAFRSNSRAMR